MCSLVGLLLLLTLAPTFALWVARIRPPHFGSITGRDLFRRSDGLPVDTVSPVDEEADDEPNLDTTPRGRRHRRGGKTGQQRAHRHLRGSRDCPARRGVGNADARPGQEQCRGRPRRAVRAHLHQPRPCVRRQATGRCAGVRRGCGALRRRDPLRPARAGGFGRRTAVAVRSLWRPSPVPDWRRHCWSPSLASPRWCGCSRNGLNWWRSWLPSRWPRGSADCSPG